LLSDQSRAASSKPSMDDIEKKDMEISAEPQSPSSDVSRSNSLQINNSSDPEKQDILTPPPTDPSKLLDNPQARPSISRSSSCTPTHPEPVPRTQRRGLLAQLAIIPEVTQPYHYARRTKWGITFTVAASAAAAPMGSAIIMPTLLPIARDFNATPTVTNLSVALYMLSMSIFPLWWSSFSETAGRRTIYIVSFGLFVVFGVLSAVAKNIAMLIVMRTLSGGAAASVQAVGAGTIADIWEPKERGRAMGLFYLGPLCGPLLAPIIGGALSQGFGWRSTQWFLVAYGGVIVVLLTFVLPETLRRRKNVVVEAEQEATTALKAEAAIEAAQLARGASRLETSHSIRPSLTRSTTRQSITLKTRKWLTVTKRIFLDPLKIILLLRFPAVAITVYYAAITFGSLYFLNISIESTFSRPPYNFSTLIVGLLYIPNSVGYFLASVFGGRWLDYIMKREAKKAGRLDEKGRLIFRPEDRMRENAWLAAIMFPGALIWYGWSVDKGVFWLVPVCMPSHFDCYY
jgi:multidrug resistance protein